LAFALFPAPTSEYLLTLLDRVIRHVTRRLAATRPRPGEPTCRLTCSRSSSSRPRPPDVRRPLSTGCAAALAALAALEGARHRGTGRPDALDVAHGLAHEVREALQRAGGDRGGGAAVTTATWSRPRRGVPGAGHRAVALSSAGQRHCPPRY
jgi:hypothetical protein